jgi:hypothetical protein
MSCEFCGKRAAAYRCTSCGTSLCSKHTGKQFGYRIFSALMALFGGLFFSAVILADTKGSFATFVPLIFAAFGFWLPGRSCIKCSKDKLLKL